MAIFRGIGGAGDSTTDATVTEVTQQATNAAASATAASSSATSAATSASNAATSASNASTSETNAATSETNAATSASSASTSATTATTKAAEASTSATNAATSETNAATSASNASTSETNASNSATAAATSATNASTSETNASNSASAASTSATNASNSATAAQTAQTAAESAQSATEDLFDQFGDQYLGSKASDPTTDNDGDPLNSGDIYWNTSNNTLRFYNGTAWVAPETIATTAATNAATSASNAATSETNASNSASSASTSASNAATSETNASNSATSASTSASTATTKASEASTSASNAATSASNAATSESNAATSESNAATSASAASTSESNAATSASNASTSATNAETAKTAAETAQSAAETAETNAETAESNAATSASNAATSATNAANSASAASTSETNAATSASNASTSESNASTSATNAANSATSAATSATNASTAVQNKFNSLSTSASTGAEGSNASSSYNSGTNTIAFTIPRGDTGPQGVQGNTGVGIYAHARVNSNGTAVYTSGVTVSKTATGIYDYTFVSSLPDSEYSVIGTPAISPGTDPNIFVSNITTTGFRITVGVGDNSSTADVATDIAHSVAVFTKGGGPSGLTNTYDIWLDNGNTGTEQDFLDSLVASLTPAEVRSLVESATDSNVFTDADHSKLNGIETGATADQTASEILTAIKTVDGTGSGLDADTLDGQQGTYYQPVSSALTTSTTFGGDVSGTYNAIVVADDSHNHVISNVDGLQTELDSKVEEGGTDFTGTYPLVARISAKNIYSNSGITYTGATDTLNVVNVAVSGTVDGRDVATDGTKLDGIEANADVTDTANVTAAGALMDSEVTNLAQVKAFDSSDYATAAQGSTADSALQNISEDTSPQLGGNLDTNGYGITLDDGNHNVTENHILLGNNGDLDIYHSSLGSVIGNNTSDLFITNVADDADVRISTKKSGSTGATVAFLADGSTGESILYHDGDQKIATKSTGIQTTGTVNVNGAYTLPTSDGTNGQVLTTDGSGAVTFADASGGGSSLTIKDEGTSLSTAATTINFTGSGVTATGTGAEKTVNIPSVAKYTEFDLAPGATSVTLNLSGDSDVQKVEFRLAAKTFSSGPNNPTFTVKTSGGTNHQWDIQGMKMYNYTDTMTGLHVDGTTDLYSFLNYYSDFSTPTVFTFYKSEGGRWTCEATIGSGTGTTGTSYVLHCRTDVGFSYSDIGSFVITTGSSSNWLSFDGTIVEYYK